MISTIAMPLSKRWTWDLWADVHNDLKACCVHKGKMGTDKSAQVLT